MRFSILRTSTLLLLVIATATHSRSGSAAVRSTPTVQPSWAGPVRVRPQDFEARLVRDAADGQLDDYDTVSAALVAGGDIRDGKRLSEYRQQIMSRCGNLAEIKGSHVHPADLFSRLHERLLTGRYHVEYTAPSRTVDEGHYNCVSATILFYWLCQQAGLEPQIVALREHVFIRLRGSNSIDIETTCPEWFSHPPSERHVRSTSGIPEREITFVQLLGKVYYNRAVAALAEQQYETAISLLRISLEMDSRDASARENLLAGFNNWALSEAESGRYSRANQILLDGMAIDSEYEPFRANDLHIHQKWVLQLCDLKRFDEAIARLEAGFVRLPDAPLFNDGRLMVHRLWAASLFAEKRDHEALNVIQQARRAYGADRWSRYEEGLAPARSPRSI